MHLYVQSSRSINSLSLFLRSVSVTFSKLDTDMLSSITATAARMGRERVYSIQEQRSNVTFMMLLRSKMICWKYVILQRFHLKFIFNPTGSCHTLCKYTEGSPFTCPRYSSESLPPIQTMRHQTRILIHILLRVCICYRSVSPETMFILVDPSL